MLPCQFRLVPVVMCFVVAACDRGRGAEARQLAKVQEALVRVRSEQERFEQRVVALEIQAADHASNARPEPPAVPSLRVVKLSPGGLAPEEMREVNAAPLRDEDAIPDRGPRQSIRVTGASSRSARTRPSSERVEQSLGEPDGQAEPRSASSDPEAKRALEVAVAVLHARHYDKALEAFAGLLVKWPDHPQADAAMSYRGDCYLATGEPLRAVDEWGGLIARFPGSPRVPEALLKAGLAYQKLGSAPKAKMYFERLVREFPRSDAARKVPEEKR